MEGEPSHLEKKVGGGDQVADDVQNIVAMCGGPLARGHGGIPAEGSIDGPLPCLPVFVVYLLAPAIFVYVYKRWEENDEQRRSDEMLISGWDGLEPRNRSSRRAFFVPDFDLPS